MVAIVKSTEENNQQFKQAIFIASCLALLVTAMTFAIRAGILSQLSAEFSLSSSELGWVNSMAFLGFPVATLFGGLLYNWIGAKKLMLLAFVCHLLGLALTITAGGFWGLLISTFFIGFANGSVEAGCNPLIAQLYSDNKTTMLNRFHVWFPGGIVVGAVLSNYMTDFNFSWQIQIAIMLVPTLIYGVMFMKLSSSKLQALLTRKESAVLVNNTTTNFKAMCSPLFLFMVFCMMLTATSELGTQQWINSILGASGASPMLIMAMITGLMALGRFFAGPVIHRLNPVGVLLASAILTTIGIYSMSIATGSQVYSAAIIFALGVTYFWPTMIGFVAENIEDSGALGMSVLGGSGMFAVSIFNPIIGGWIDSSRQEASLAQLSPQATELMAGQSVLTNLTIFPMILIVAFTVLFFIMKKQVEPSNISFKAKQNQGV